MLGKDSVRKTPCTRIAAELEPSASPRGRFQRIGQRSIRIILPKELLLCLMKIYCRTVLV